MKATIHITIKKVAGRKPVDSANVRTAFGATLSKISSTIKDTLKIMSIDAEVSYDIAKSD